MSSLPNAIFVVGLAHTRLNTRLLIQSYFEVLVNFEWIPFSVESQVPHRHNAHEIPWRIGTPLNLEFDFPIIDYLPSIHHMKGFYRPSCDSTWSRKIERHLDSKITIYITF